MVECNRCLFTSEIAEINGQCEYCDLHDKLDTEYGTKDIYPLIEKIKNKKGKYNCLIGISGGLDSSLLLYLAIKWGLKPLVIHFDNKWNTPQSEQNITNLINWASKYQNITFIRYSVDDIEYNELNLAFLRASIPDADIPNDIAMTKLMYDTAEQYGIKYILNGHDFRTEGSTPKGWTYMDGKYINSVYKAFYGRNLLNYPIFTFKDQLRAALKGIKQVRPYYYIKNRESIESEMKKEIGWSDYGGKHCENTYTEFVGSYLLPKKFNIDKRLVYLSAQIRSGKLDKSEAKLIMQLTTHFDIKRVDSILKQLPFDVLQTDIGSRDLYAKYNFKKYKFVIWLLAKLKVVPYTFYVKYAK